MGRLNRLCRVAIPAAAISVAALAGPGGPGAVGRAQAVVPVRLADSTSDTVPGGQLWGVAAVSPAAAWAVGWTDNTNTPFDEKPLLLQWNGKKWSHVPVKGVLYGELLAVSAVSAHDVWVAGQSYDSSNPGVLILHWNGKTWSSLIASGMNVSFRPAAVAATAHDVWIAAYNGHLTGFLHLSGGRWYVVPTTLPLFCQVTGLAEVSPTAAWAAGVCLGPGDSERSFLLRWNGSAWKQVADPLASQTTQAMAGGPDGAVWMVGWGKRAGAITGQSALWDGRNWNSAPPCPGCGGFFQVTFIPGGTAWAVDLSGLTIAHWTGKAWTVAVLRINSTSSLNAVAASSVRDAWAVGSTPGGTSGTASLTTLILHWNGKTWS